MIYWDNNATTPLAPEVYEAMEPFLKERFFNPSAGYGCARHVREAVEEARAAVAALLGAFPSEMYLLPAERRRLIWLSARWPGSGREG